MSMVRAPSWYYDSLCVCVCVFVHGCVNALPDAINLLVPRLQKILNL